jgi:serine phosphatase RsbU (regulator of sigma subunit)
VTEVDKERNDTSQNEVVVDDISYLEKKFKAKKEEEQKVIDGIAQEYSLNEEQERAFRIVANHATMKKSEQLTISLSLRRNSFITPDLEDFFSSTNAELCLSPTKIDGFPQSGFLL